MKSMKPRKQRKQLYNAPLHKKRKWIASHLSENLLLKYNRRSIPVIKGDTVKVMRGAFKGHENKVTRVDVKKGFVEIEGITLSKADGKKIARHIHPSNLLITKLNLSDKWRRRRLEQGLPEETKKEIEEEAVEQKREIEEEKRKEVAEEAETEEVKEESTEIKEEPQEEEIEKTEEIEEKLEGEEKKFIEEAEQEIKKEEKTEDKKESPPADLKKSSKKSDEKEDEHVSSS